MALIYLFFLIDIRTALYAGILCFKDLLTHYISAFKARFSQNSKVKEQSAGNQRRFKSSLVGTSETTRAVDNNSIKYNSKKITNFNFAEWFAGLIDGDGYFLVSKQGYCSLEITVDINDLPMLHFIQNYLHGGSVKKRSGSNSYRYRIHNKAGMLAVVNLVNGHIRHSTRLKQLHVVCQTLGLELIQPMPITECSNWFAGFFDADGTISYSIKDGRPQLSVRASNKRMIDVELFVSFFGGSLYFDKSQNGYYAWSVQSRADILDVTPYFIKYCKSNKAKRFYLVDTYFDLRDKNAFKIDSTHHNDWKNFNDTWFNRALD